MIVNGIKYLQSSLYPNTNWLNNNNFFIIDETTQKGHIMAKTYISNYPFVDFEHDGKFVTKVIILEDEKFKEQKKLEQKKIENNLEESLKPSNKEVLIAEVELNTINLLLESGVI